jgi:TonB family protein
MTVTILHLLSLSAKIALLGGIAWTQLYLLRRAPASLRSRLCAAALAAILLLSAGEIIGPNWMAKAPVYSFNIAATAATSPVAGRTPVGVWVAWLWMAGAAFMLLRAIVGRTVLAILRRNSSKLESVAGVDVRLAKVQTPLMTGLLRPTILLPEAAPAWTGEQRSMVLTHELTHFRQGDAWTLLLGQVLRALLWFHPVVWLLVSRLSREQELTCDEAVVASGHSPHDYAAFLLDAVRNLNSREMFACAMAGSGAQSLKKRFARLLDPMPRRALTRRMLVSIGACGLVAMSLALVRPVWSQSERKVYKVGGDVTSPKVLSRVEPQYTQEDKANKIQGTVKLKLIVTAEGTADSIEVVRSLTPGLDQKAIDAVTQWTFQPATKEGKPVDVWVNIEVNFRLL